MAPIVKTCESKMVAGEVPETIIAGSRDELNYQDGFVGNPMNRRISARGVCRSGSDGAAAG